MPNSLCPTDYTYLSFLPCHLNGVIALSSTEYITQIRNPSTLVTMTDLSKHIAFEMCYASLKRHPKEFPHPTTTSSPLIPSATMSPIFWTPLSFKVSKISLHPVTLSVGMLNIPNTSRRPSSVTTNAT